MKLRSLDINLVRNVLKGGNRLLNKTKKITYSGIVIALYIIIIYLTSSLSFGTIQIRVANILYGLCFKMPFLVIPLSMGVILSNLLFGGLGIVDIIGGTITTLVTTYLISKCKKPIMIIPIMIFTVALGISTYLHLLLNIPFSLLFIQIALGQIIPSILSYLIVKRIK